MRILFALAGLHRVDRGAEVAFISVARELVKLGHEVTLIGSGAPRLDEPYRYIQVPAVPRKKFEHWPSLPTLRSDTGWEEATFAIGLLGKFRPAHFDITATCAYPWTHWALRRPVLRGRAPKSVFVTQNGDWPAFSDKAEFRSFACDGLVCTNPDYFERNSDRYRCALIPNGVDLDRFHPGESERDKLGLSVNGPIVLMVSALIPSKHVVDGVEAVAKMPGASLVVAGDGPLRDEVEKRAANLLPGRFHRLSLPAAEMPALYRSADVFMHLSVDESFGNVFVEALATGLPIVAYDTPRTRWIIGNEGFLADRAPGDLQAALGAALQSVGSPKTSGKRAADFGWPAIGARYDKFFRDLAA